MDMDLNKIEHKLGFGKSWSSWTSPVGLGIFLLTAVLAFAILVYTLLNLFVSFEEVAHPTTTSQSMSAQELQQLEQSSTGTTGAAQ
ncbi:MAG: hypothetical protein P4M11_06125 [Candidatus Pacebacteria bacterium]|nr:hypothetical protein [Candidatus Paceibacterota bacterium]